MSVNPIQHFCFLCPLEAFLERSISSNFVLFQQCFLKVQYTCTSLLPTPVETLNPWFYSLQFSREFEYTDSMTKAAQFLRSPVKVRETELSQCLFSVLLASVHPDLSGPELLC